MWVPPETRDPILLHHPTHRNIGYLGAVRWRDGKFVFQQEAHRFNALTFFDFLKKLQRASEPTWRRVVVILDNARYHHAKLLHEWREDLLPLFGLDFLPPYSPDLNPIERVWRLVRRKCIHNKYFPLLEDIILTVENQFAQWACGSNDLIKLCVIN
jgi:transposase